MPRQEMCRREKAKAHRDGGTGDWMRRRSLYPGASRAQPRRDEGRCRFQGPRHDRILSLSLSLPTTQVKQSTAQHSTATTTSSALGAAESVRPGVHQKRIPAAVGVVWPRFGRDLYRIGQETAGSEEGLRAVRSLELSPPGFVLRDGDPVCRV